MPQVGFIKRTQMLYGDYEFTPAPLFSWSTDTVRSANDEQLFQVNTLDFAGTLLVEAGESGQLDKVIEKQDQLRAALASGNQEFRIFYDSVPIVSGIYPRVENVTITEGVWVDRADYSFTLTYDNEVEDGDAIESFSEAWQFEEEDNRRTVAVSHNISAVGLNTNPSGASNAIFNARDFVLARVGYSNVTAGSPFFAQVSGVSFSAYEELRSENHDVQGGSFSVSENFILSSGTFINTSTGQFAEDENGIVTVGINGQVRGLGRGDQAFYNALDGFNDEVEPELTSLASGIYTEFGGVSKLNINNREGYSVTRNQFAGTVDYSVSYTDDPASDLPDGIQEFEMNISNDVPTKVYATFIIPDKASGPFVQDINTTRVGRYTLQGRAVGKPTTAMSEVLDYVDQQVERFLGPGNIIQNTITKDIRKKTVTFNIGWEYVLGISASAVDRPIIV
jgi:hypothetical protein